MRVILLGTAAGGGFPQWNCACALCVSDAPPRTQDCVAVSADGEGWYLLNVSPDIRAQILTTPPLRAGPGPREIPLRGVLLTDAELDHSLGLLLLREAGGLPVWAPEAVLDALSEQFPARSIIDGYGGWDWLPSSDVSIDGLRVSMLPVSDKRPKYARSSTEDGPWVVAYRIEDVRTGGVFVYAPCLKSWPDGFDDFTRDAGLVLLDGTFYAPDEMSGATAAEVGDGAQLAMGHLPITGSLAKLRPGPRWVYTHLNNTNPVIDPASPEHAAVLAGGASLPLDGTEFKL
ncbi:pyrroloquinoline quinone biosynthesis protein PqqB [Amycolatopsis keratiniphila]|uniref:pyrroloquinoline quinone biosynthesis protein PqqB n=1 Tax=Amycolatopsis keratiniphila TaxID=129921 RepID=UPI00087D9CB6|nr:pyrroloquinoline quinone biosynthesis protein PqqB [Amycolatopsis keratiniphila]OLZ54861.1 pyrroloquinoline quinone biosynthesis protein B [Amycolatopsis keratiniphila subsp. nogabecina]SDU65380.1 pyrroloquinoline quinone biosynthesis protein B [Amycolatopsis keratiniphila]